MARTEIKNDNSNNKNDMEDKLVQPEIIRRRMKTKPAMNWERDKGIKVLIFKYGRILEWILRKPC